MMTASCWKRRRAQLLDGREDATEHSAADGHLGQLERDGARMVDHALTGFDQPGLQAGQ